ncbi:hypothetical protein AADZ91_05200 [Colwelliaceae bacterium 6441]
MTQTHSRYIQVGEWFFELKSVRAIKVDEYGKPYQAIANCNINGDKMYVDGLLTTNGEEFTKTDFLSFYQFCQKIGLDSFSYHRFQDGESVHREVPIKANKERDIKKESSQSNDPQDSLLEETSPIRLVK